MKILLSAILFLIIACSRNEAEYYGYAKKEDANQKSKIVLSPSEEISKAIQDDQWEIISNLIKNGLSANTILDSGRTLLNESVVWERESIFKNLILLGADPKIKDQTGMNTLESCQDKINFLVLLDADAKTKYEIEFFGYLEAEDTDEAKRMLEQKLNPNFTLASGETPLTYSVTNEFENNVRLLVSPAYKINIHQKNSSGKTALILAREFNLKRIEKILMSRGAQF